jgi:hypothetical protein
MKNMLSGFYALFFVLNATISLSNGGQIPVCESICQQWSSLFRCRQFTSESFGSENLGQSLVKLYKTISDVPPVQILPSELMSMFNVPHDPCQRGKTRILEHKFENLGKECVLRTRYELPLIGQPINFVLEIPDSLHGNVHRNKESIQFKFLSKLNIVVDGGLMTDYLNIGGTVNDIEMSNNMITVSVDVNNSLMMCLKISYKE